MAQQNSSEEIDLGTIWRKTRELSNDVLLFFYKLIRFLLKNWLIIIALIVAGIIIGYFLEKTGLKGKEGNLIVQINFDASNYVYNSIEHLNNKIVDNDTVFLKKYGFYNNKEVILTGVEIEPIVNIADILNNVDTESKNIEPVLEQAKYEDNMLTSEIFIPEYKSHRITIKTNKNGSSETIEDILAYLNDSELMQRIKDLTVINTAKHIQRTEESIASIDSIVKRFGTRPVTKPGGQIYFNTVDENDNMHMLFALKNTLIKNKEEMEIELLKYNNIVIPLDTPHLAWKRSFFDSKMKILPLLFVLLFIVFSYLLRLYHKAARIEKERNGDLDD